MTSTATPSQINYILSLASSVTGERYSYLSQARHVIGISSSKAQRGLSRSEASQIIDDLKRAAR